MSSVPIALAAVAAFAATLVAASVMARAPRSSRLARARRGAAEKSLVWRRVLNSAGEGTSLPPGAPAQVNLAAALAGAAAGLAALGPAGALLGVVAGPPSAAMLLRARRARYAARIDACAADLALAIASSLAAGHSVRGALLAADASVPAPLSGELVKTAAELTLGRSTDDALAALRSRAASVRVDSLCGAIALHRRSGADLALLLRELAAAFRARDAARADARAAMAQARFTAAIVGFVPVAGAALAELAAPGSVSGALAFAPTAVMMLAALALMLTGVALCLRVGRV